MIARLFKTVFKQSTTHQYLPMFFMFIAVILSHAPANAAENIVFGSTLGIHFNVPAGQPSTTINSGSITLWCNTTCTDPSDLGSIPLHGSGFPISPGNYTYVCTLNGVTCYPADNIVNASHCNNGPASIKIVNNYANGSTFTSQCLSVTISSNTMVMVTPSTQTMCTTTMPGSCT